MIATVARPVLSLVAAILFAGLGVLAFLELPERQGCCRPPTSPECSGSGCEEVQQTKQALNALQSGEFDKAAEAVSSERGIVPAGDSCGMRRANIMPPLARKSRAVFAAASVAASPATRLEILNRLGMAEPGAVWRIRIEKSEIARRAGDMERALQEAEAAIALGPPGTCVSDAWLSKALASNGDTRTSALVAAVEADPGHYNAWARLAVDLMTRMDRGLAAADCDVMAARIVETIVYLDKLSKTDAQLARLERLANAATGGSSLSRALLLAMVQERTKRREAAVATYAKLVSGTGAVCAAPIELVARTRLAALQPEGKS